MIRSKSELKFFIAADLMMNRGKFGLSIKDRIKHLVLPDNIMLFMKHMRYFSYYKSKVTNGHTLLRLGNTAFKLYHEIRFRKLSEKLGFTIGEDVFGYGLLIGHSGTIVVGASNRIGNYAVLHTSTCITCNGKKIGDGLYLGTGAKMTSTLSLGNNVSVGANSVVNKSFESNCMIAGAPARFIKTSQAWYHRDGDEYRCRVEKCETLRQQLGL